MDNKISTVDHENIMEMVDTEGMESLIKLMRMKVQVIGQDILHEDLGKASFGAVGVKLAKYQGAQELANFIEREVKQYKKRALKQ